MNQLIVKPLITEKTMNLAQRGFFTFAVHKLSDKCQIAAKISDLYKVDVLEVRTVTMHGKIKKAGRRQIKKASPDWKKTVVKLKTGQTINAFQVVKDEPLKK